MIVITPVLNVRSGPGTQYRVLAKVKKDDKVAICERSGDWVWISPASGWVHVGYLAEERITVPIGIFGIQTAFGEAASPQCYAGRVKLPAPLKLSWSSASVTQFACHALMETIFTQVFQEIHARGLWSKLSNFGGCYNDRPTRNGAKKSTHAWGISVDLNTSTNAQGTRGDMDEQIIDIFESYGFVWGGNFSGRSIDPMHFQYARGY